MDPLKAYSIPFVGLKLGEHHFEYDIDNTFFACFEYDAFNAVAIKATLVLNKKTTLMELLFKIEGNVNVNCDLTNEAYNQNLEASFNQVVKFGEHYNNDNEELLILPHNEYELKVEQQFYELIILSLPRKLIHPGVKDGSLQSEALKKLEELSLGQRTTKPTDGIDPRWQSLEKLLKQKDK